MITALQASKIATVNALMEAREALLNVSHQICLSAAEARYYLQIVSEVEETISNFITNDTPYDKGEAK